MATPRVRGLVDRFQEFLQDVVAEIENLEGDVAYLEREADRLANELNAAQNEIDDLHAELRKQQQERGRD